MRTMVALGATALVLVPRAEAQRTSFGLGFAYQQVAVDSVTAVDRGMGDSGPEIHLAMDLRFRRYVVTSLELGALFFKDLRPYSQNVICIPNCGGGSTKSTINTTMFGMSLGLQSPRVRLGRVSLGPSVRVGMMGVSANRGVNCSDCDKQDLALTGGGYVDYRLTAVIAKPKEHGMTVAIGYRSFLSDNAPFAPSIALHVGMLLNP
jgi:hypothetical protein